MSTVGPPGGLPSQNRARPEDAAMHITVRSGGERGPDVLKDGGVERGRRGRQREIRKEATYQ
jgi:hypothetical protein